MRVANRQAIVVFNTLITVGGAFAFGFFGMGYAVPSLQTELLFRLSVGVLLALIVFFADLYFIIKGMDDPGDKPIKVTLFFPAVVFLSSSCDLLWFSD
ncbi:unnamed protein product [Anisakis simplex]|uniref:Transmembrane protein 199 (inferred by orthology to a human protein) n=1 Tax=Anisakis simplex TaxID=6269 RepID=A0A0M3JZ14_ANISI|nr:unnamed protein product [Anisakis simplex]